MNLRKALKYSTPSLVFPYSKRVFVYLSMVFGLIHLLGVAGYGQVFPLQPLESTWLESLSPAVVNLWIDDRYGRHLVKEQHRWRSASEVFAEACWYQAALAVADYYLSPGPRNTRDLHLFLNLIQQVARQPATTLGYLPLHNRLFAKPEECIQIGEDSFIRQRLRPTYRPELQRFNSELTQP
jgi:hypothetical protein